MNTQLEPPEKPDFSYTHHVVAFLDLLGQKDRIKELDGVLNDGEIEDKKQKIEGVLKQTLGSIWEFRRDFTKYYELYSSQRPSVQIPKEVEKHFHQMRKHSKIHFQSFSDSIINWASVGMKEEFDCAQVLNSINGILSSVGMMMPLYLYKKIPFRGGIDIEGGISIVPGGDEIYGPVLNRAYILESHAAQYPRVVIGSGLIDFLNYAGEIKLQDKVVEQYCKTMANLCKDWIVLDEDQLPIIHFLGPNARRFQNTTKDSSDLTRQLLESAGQFITESVEKFKNDEKLGERYQRLKRYFDKYIQDW